MPTRPALLTLLLLAMAVTAVAQQSLPHARPFPPEDLGLLEAPDRDIWQKPDEVMDALHIADGSRVADIGAGAGWFTVRLARRVGPNGVVYAEDINPLMIAAINYRISRENLGNVRTVEGKPEDPMLPGGLDAVLIVDVYAEISDPVSLLSDVATALKPQGRVGIIAFTKEGGGPGPPMDERVEPEQVIEDAQAAGLVLLSHETFLTYQFLLIFGVEPPMPAADDVSGR